MREWLKISANRRAIAYIIFTVAVLGAMFFLGIHPARQKTLQAKKKIDHLKAHIEKQEIFQPIYSRLQEKTADKNNFDQLASIRAKSGTPEFSIGNVSEILSGMAASAGINKTSFSPAPASTTQGSDELLVHGQLSGNYLNFRDFLAGLALAPDFRRFEMLEIQSGIKYPKYRLEIWVKVK